MSANIALKRMNDNSNVLFPATTVENIVDFAKTNITKMSSGSATNGQIPMANGSGRISWQSLPVGVSYTTTAPTAANTDGTLHFVVLAAEPATYYNGYYYIITGA